MTTPLTLMQRVLDRYPVIKPSVVSIALMAVFQASGLHAAQIKTKLTIHQEKPSLVHVDLGKKGIYFRVQAGYFSNANIARAACARLKAKRQDCIIIAPKLDGKG